jgi:hypothetical protein
MVMIFFDVCILGFILIGIGTSLFIYDILIMDHVGYQSISLIIIAVFLYQGLATLLFSVMTDVAIYIKNGDYK